MTPRKNVVKLRCQVALVCSLAVLTTCKKDKTSEHPKAETVVSLWKAARDAETSAKAFGDSSSRFYGALASAIAGEQPAGDLEALHGAFAAAGKTLAEAEGRVDATRDKLLGNPGGFGLERGLVDIAVGFRRAQHLPQTTTIFALQEYPACGMDLAADHLLLDHLDHLFHGRDAEAAVLLARFNDSLRCLSIRQAFRVDAQLALVLESVAVSLSADEARALRAHVLPILLITLDVTKSIGTTPLMEHLSGHLADYASAFVADGDAVIPRFGIWLQHDGSGHLRQFRKFCETGSSPGCLHGAGLLQALTDPVALGLGECSAVSMISAGMVTGLGYACRRGVCFAAAGSAGVAGGVVPAGAQVVGTAGKTQFGTGLGVFGKPGNLVGGACGGGGGGTKSASGPGSAVPSAIACAIAVVQAEAAESSPVKCIEASIPGGLGAIFALPEIELDTRHVAPGCMLAADGGSDTGSNTGSSTTQKEKDEEAKKLAAAALRDPNVQKEIQKEIKDTTGVTVPMDKIKAACETAAQNILNAGISRDGQVPANGEESGYTTHYGDKYDIIVVDGDYTDKAETDASGSLYQNLIHEGLHSALYQLGMSSADNYHHDFMEDSGLSPEYSCLRRGPCGQQLCAADEGCADSCNTVSAAARAFSGCVIAQANSGTPGGSDPGYVDPSPLDVPHIGDGILQCFGQFTPKVGSTACLAVDCGPDGSATVNGAGICTCGGGSSSAGGLLTVGAGQCGAIDCQGAAPTMGPLGCSCLQTKGRFPGLAPTKVDLFSRPR
jgi:hypothetical protein